MRNKLIFASILLLGTAALLVSQQTFGPSNRGGGGSGNTNVLIQSGTANNLYQTNSFYAVGSSNSYQEFKSTTTNTGGILNQVAPWRMAQFANNQPFSDPHQDVQTIWGYNITGSGAVANTNEVCLFQSLESDWQNAAGSIQTELYWSYTFPYTNSTTRFLAFNFQRSTNTIPNQTLANGDGNINGNLTVDSFRFYSPYSAQSDGFGVTSSATSTSVGNAVTLDVYGQINMRSNWQNRGEIVMLGNDVLFKNFANNKSTQVYTGFPGDGQGFAAQDGNFIIQNNNSKDMQWENFTKEHLDGSGSVSFGGANILARLTVTNSSAQVAERIDQQNTTNAISKYLINNTLAVSIETNFLNVAGNVGITSTTISGAGNGNTNYTLLADKGKQYLGSSNVNISAVMNYIAGTTFKCTVIATNLSANTWGISFSAVTNRWWFRGLAMQTNSPTVITNNTALRLDLDIDGTNIFCNWQHYAPFP